MIMEYWQKESYRESVSKSAGAVVNGGALKGKRILVTGASGMIGSFVTDVLIELGSEVCAAGRKPEALSVRFPEAKTLRYDLNDEIDFDKRFDHVIHAAGYQDRCC